MPETEIEIEGQLFPRLFLGSSPWMGAGQFGQKAISYYEKFFLNPDNITELMVYFGRQYTPAVHLCLCEPLVKAGFKARELLGKEFLWLATLFPENQELNFQWAKALGVKILFLHAQATDRLFRRELEEFCQTCRELKIIPGFATHNPGFSIPRIDLMELDFSVYLAPLNPSGLHIHPDLASSLKAVQETSKTVIGMKTLMAGELEPEKAFPFAFSYLKAITVGMTSKEEIDQDLRAFRQWQG